MSTLATIYGNDAAIRTMLREAVGHPNQTVLLPDPTVDGAIKRALSRLNVDISTLFIGTFSTVADTQVYSPLPVNAYGVINVWYPAAWGADCDRRWWPFLDGVFALLGNVDQNGIIFVPHPADIAALIRRNEWLRSFSGAGAAISEDNAVYLTPVPSDVQTVVFSYTAATYATVGAVAELDAEPFIALCTSFLHERLAAGAGGVSYVNDTSEGASIRTESPVHHRQLADARRRDYLLMKRAPPQDWRGV